MLLGCIGSARDVASYHTSVTGRYIRFRGMPVTSNPVLLYIRTDARHDRCSLGSQAGSRASPGPFGAGPAGASATSRSRYPSSAPLSHLGSGFALAHEEPTPPERRPPLPAAPRLLSALFCLWDSRLFLLRFRFFFFGCWS